LFPAIEFTLTNGLRVLVVEDHHAPIVAVQVWYGVGSVDEPAGRAGFAHLFEHMMFRGTDRLGPTDHMDLVRSVGGEGNAYTSFDETCYHETLPAAQLDLALWLESERMGFLTVDAAGFATERRVVEEERRMGLNQPYGDLVDKGPPAIFGTHPYANSPIGNLKDLRQATAADVHAWWVRWYTPNNATLVVVGDVQPNQVRAGAERHFGWMPGVPKEASNVPMVLPYPEARSVTFELENAPAPGVARLWRTVPEGHPDALALGLVATILGGGESSRLYRRLVVEDRVAVVAMAVGFGLERGGVFGAGAVLSPIGGNPARVLPALEEEIERLRRGGVTADELDKARNQAMSQLVLGAQTVAGKAQLVGRAAVLGQGVGELNGRIGRLQQLTPQDLQAAATRHLDPHHALTVTVPSSGLLKGLGRMFLGRKKAEEEAPVAASSDTMYRGRSGVTRPKDRPDRAPIQAGNPPMPHPLVQERRLANGLRLLVVPNATMPVFKAVLVLPFGAWAETKPGAAALTLSVLTKATETHDQKALAEALDREAIRMSGVAGEDDSLVEVECLAGHADRALALLAEVVTQPTFPDAPMKTAVTQTITGLAIEDNDPSSVADREFRRHFFAGHPYARRVSGEASDLGALRRDDLVAFWRHVARPDRACLVIAGGVDVEAARTLAERSFAGWKTADTTPIPEPALPPEPGTNRIVLVEWSGAAQSEIRIGGRGLVTRDPDKPLGDLVTSYFGGSYGSRLMKAVRIEKGATYGASGGFRPQRFAGTFRVGTFTKTASTADTVRTVLGEIRGVIERAPNDAELTLHRRYFLGSAAARFETAGQLADQYARLAANDLPLDYVPQAFARIGAATAEDCQKLACRRVEPDRMLVVVVGDGAVAAELRKIAPVTVVDRNGQIKP
jgi:zinc protease